MGVSGQLHPACRACLACLACPACSDVLWVTAWGKACQVKCTELTLAWQALWPATHSPCLQPPARAPPKP